MVRGAPVKTVQQYLNDLKGSRKDKPEQVKEALDVYIDLWNRAIERGVVSAKDDINEALNKMDKKGGLYQASQD